MSIDITAIVEQYVRDLVQLPRRERSLDQILGKALLADREIRRLFALYPQDLRLHDMYIGLLDVFKILAIARRTRARSTAPSSPSFSQEFVFPLRPDRRRAHLTPSTVITFDAL